MWDGIICCFLFRCCWLLLGAVRYFFFYLIHCFWVYVALLFFLMSASLLIPRHSCTNLSLQLHIVKCRNIREQEKTQAHTHEHARTHRHTIIIHKHGGTTTTSSIATHRVFVHSVDSVFYFIIFLVQMVVVHVFASSTENWKYLRILIFFAPWFVSSIRSFRVWIENQSQFRNFPPTVNRNFINNWALRSVLDIFFSLRKENECDEEKSFIYKVQLDIHEF